MLVTRSPVRRSVKKSPISNNLYVGANDSQNNYPPGNVDNSGISGISKDQIGCSQISYSPSEKPKFGKSIVEVNNTDDIKNFAS